MISPDYVRLYWHPLLRERFGEAPQTSHGGHAYH